MVAREDMYETVEGGQQQIMPRQYGQLDPYAYRVPVNAPSTYPDGYFEPMLLQKDTPEQIAAKKRLAEIQVEKARLLQKRDSLDREIVAADERIKAAEDAMLEPIFFGGFAL